MGAKGDREVLVATHLQAVEASRHPVAIKAEAACAFEELRQHHLGFQAGEGCADTVVDTTAEREVVARRGAVEPHVVGFDELLRIAIGGAPKQQNGGSGGYIDAAETCVVRCMPHQETEWRLEAK